MELKKYLSISASMGLALGALAGACSDTDSVPVTPRAEEAAPSPGQQHTDKQGQHGSKRTDGVAHDPSNPPIDCPLRKQGINPDHLRPFEDVEKYISFLERKDRAPWQKPDDVVKALDLAGDETVVDLGAGSGYFSFRFAKALPQGKVIAADIEPEMIRHIHHKAMADSVLNIEAALIKSDDPAIPAGVDLVFMCDVLHHVENRPAWLAKIVKAIPSGARIVLIEFKEGDLPQGPPESMKIPRDGLVKLVTDAGMSLEKENAELLPYQTFLVFQKP